MPSLVRLLESLFSPPVPKVQVRLHGDVGVLVLRGKFSDRDTEATTQGIQELLDLEVTGLILNLRDALFIEKRPVGELVQLWIKLGKSNRPFRIVQPVRKQFWWDQSGSQYEDETQALESLREPPE